MNTINIQTEEFPNIHYRKTGTGPVAVLVHGFPEDGTLWDKIFPVLSASLTLLIPDIPGSGKSKVADEKTDMALLAESISRILDNEQVHNAVIIGHSMGGYIALAFADKYASRVQGISLVHSTATADSEEKKEIRRKSIELIRKGAKEAFVKGMIPNLFSSAYKQLYPEMIEAQVKRGLQLEADSMVSFYKAMINRPDRTAILSSGRMPVQWIIGREDNVVPLDTALQQSKMARVNFVSLYNDCGHMSMLEQPEQLATDLKDFISYCYNH